MAKWGEGDPRWIVEERPDATNVNNWHWTEKNATHWSKERFNSLFNEYKIEQDAFVVTMDRINKCDGEATVNNRKGKLIFFYEWAIVLEWSGSMPSRSQNVHKGKVTIPNLSEENDLHEIEITVTIDDSNDESETIKQFMYNIGRDKIRKQIALYIKELKEEYSKNLVLPKKGEESTNNVSTNAKVDLGGVDAAAFKKVTITANNGASDKSASVGCKLDVKALDMTVEFQCSAHDLYNALTKAEMLTSFTGGPVKVEPIRGGEFLLYGGNVQGKFQELVPQERIVQTWRLKSWPSGYYSNVVMNFEETASGTKLKLQQTGIPASEFASMTANWHRFYWNSIKRTFGFGFLIEK